MVALIAWSMMFALVALASYGLKQQMAMGVDS
jgi:hypothetical protein